MKIKMGTEMVTFEYDIIKDTPECVARDFCHQMKLDKSMEQYFKDAIKI